MPIPAPGAVSLANTELLAVSLLALSINDQVAHAHHLQREALPVAEAFVEREPTPETEDVENRACRYGCL